MRRRVLSMLAALALVLSTAGSVVAGNGGYEGQPGNQSSGGGGGGGGTNGNGPSGYEGRPGNQGN